MSVGAELVSLNSELAKNRITPSASTNVTLTDHHCYTVGNLACINISFTMSADAGSTDNLITGLPAAAIAVPVIAVRNLTGGGSQAYITSNGTLRNNWDSFVNGKTYYVNCCYAIA